jgi:rfaE bifunctional protein nucleotidyltransferase chain/domain
MIRVVVNGTFDLLHLGHVELLKYAASLGDYLLVCIDSDDCVRRLKGPSRPVNSQHERAEILASLRMVDQVMVFQDQQHLEQILRDYAADIMVKGSDYRDKPITGSQYCKKVVYFDRITEYSTTDKIQSIIGR